MYYWVILASHTIDDGLPHRYLNIQSKMFTHTSMMCTNEVSPTNWLQSLVVEVTHWGLAPIRTGYFSLLRVLVCCSIDDVCQHIDNGYGNQDFDPVYTTGLIYTYLYGLRGTTSWYIYTEYMIARCRLGLWTGRGFYEGPLSHICGKTDRFYIV